MTVHSRVDGAEHLWSLQVLAIEQQRLRSQTTQIATAASWLVGQSSAQREIDLNVGA
ncbi:hypothetical protein GCM10007884_51380 [Methylobacterium brachythecii]|uniref:Uncharacterized protein n=1 Tax=Methylobacterium brachythecii TaxID=1176177 RepID=A0ABQ6DBZ6_9HYPH|nr:hypothetical protein GCM10007884_51380 [Methylobacterium brachythecii]